MNIFVLGDGADPVKSAQDQLDKHVVKMPLETAQLLCSVFHAIGTYLALTPPYRKTHANHPCAIWARQSRENFDWLVEHGMALGAEYTYRYGKAHKSLEVVQWCHEHRQALAFPQTGLTVFAQAMPEPYRRPDPVAAYRAYYLGEKQSMATWKRRSQPNWWR